MTDVPPPPASSGGGGSQLLANPLVGSWKLVVLERYAQFQGRSGRAEFWWYVLASLIIGVVFNILIAADIFFLTGIFWVLYLIYGLAVLIPGLAVAVRRLHDTGKTGWWVLIVLVPFVGAIVLIVLWAMEGTPGQNNYGMPDTV